MSPYREHDDVPAPERATAFGVWLYAWGLLLRPVREALRRLWPGEQARWDASIREQERADKASEILKAYLDGDFDFGTWFVWADREARARHRHVAGEHTEEIRTRLDAMQRHLTKVMNDRWYGRDDET